jgi:hypothetical protein
MIKRSFIGLIKPRMKYEAIELTPPEPREIPAPKQMTLLLNEPYDPFGQEKSLQLKKGDPIKTGQKLALFEDSEAYVVQVLREPYPPYPPLSGTSEGLIRPFQSMLRKMKRLTNNFRPS